MPKTSKVSTGEIPKIYYKNSKGNLRYEKSIACCFGTRPEIIKMAPVIYALRQVPDFEVTLIATAQHREMLDEMLALFDIHPDVDLNCMLPDQSLSTLTANLLTKMSFLLDKKKYDLVLVQGDTTTAMALALACFYQNIPVAHIEAGMRTGALRNPFPEELNRVLISTLAQWHFVPTHNEYQNLLNERVLPENIFITGNTVIDSVRIISEQAALPKFLSFDPNKKLILVTAHRRESFGTPLWRICQALKLLVSRFPDIEIVYPVHPNPKVQRVVYQILSNVRRIHLVGPLSYEHFIACMKRCYFIMTDSGGIQEEAPPLGKPILVLRDRTERTETITCGSGKLVGTKVENIVTEASLLLEDSAHYKEMATPAFPYGDGYAAEKIVDILQNFLLDQREEMQSETTFYASKDSYPIAPL